MKMQTAALLLLLGLISACAPVDVSPAPTQPPTANLPTPNLPTPTQGPISGGGYPPAVYAARDLLADTLGTPAEEIDVANVEPVDWPDACLGVDTGEMCAQVITPGYRVYLRVGVVRYEFHTNADGSMVRQAGEPAPDTGGEAFLPVLSWQSAGCEQLQATPETVMIGACGAEMGAAEGMAPEYLAVLADWTRAYASFSTETPAGAVTLVGAGPRAATAAEQRMMAEWARLTFDIAQSGRAGAAWGLALTWGRQGGIAGFCDDVGIYLDGRAIVSSCKPQDTPLPALRLNATQLEQLYAWYDTYGSIEHVSEDPGTADGMTIRLYLYGQGTQQPDEQAVQAMSLFSAEVVALADFSLQAGNQPFSARDVMERFFSLLHAGEYAAAADLYGGEIAGLEGWNPGLEGDLPVLLERGCTANGLQCLPLRSTTYRGPDARGGYQFLVEFMTPDGGLFRQGPCCGDDTGASTSLFLVSVVDQSGAWKVMDLPPYVP